MRATTYASRREIFGWGMFDFANQAYTLLIITVIYGDFFVRVIVGSTSGSYQLGNFLWSLALTLSYLAIALTSPLIGAFADQYGCKKKLLAISYFATIGLTASLFWVAPGMIGLGFCLILLSNYAYSIGVILISSFLPDIATPDEMGRVSGFGWALGYIGGMIATLITVLSLGTIAAETFDTVRWVGPITASFFALAAIPTFIWLKNRHHPIESTTPFHLRQGFQQVKCTFIQMRWQHPDLFWFFGSFLFAMASLYIIISFSFIYGAQIIHWSSMVRNIMFILTQIFAAVGAFLFGWIQDRIGAKRTYLITIAVWIIVIGLIWATPILTQMINRLFHWHWHAQWVFLAVGSLTGLALGGCQSAGRTLVGLFTPKAQTGEMFGFWGVIVNCAGALGLIGLGVIQLITGLQNAILLCIILFIIAGGLAFKVNEQRGRDHACKI